MLFDELVSTALLGTRVSEGRLPTFPADLAAALPSSPQDAEHRFLDATAAATLYLRAGRIARQGIEPPEPAAADRWSECSPRAGDILAQSLEDRFAPLLGEWLQLARAAQVRPPHRLLPQLLDVAAAKRLLQFDVSQVIDERGRWLMKFNPRWQFANQSQEPSEEAWHIGNRSQRSEALLLARFSGGAKAREWIAATWKADAADERMEWVKILEIGLSDEDEDFLETCLDDRSSRMREAAADLLARLPNSRLVRRMTERVASLIEFTAAKQGKLLKLKLGTKAQLQVKLPEEFDAAMLRDGMYEKPNRTLGPKQWWLLQMLGCVPLDYWTRAYRTTPVELIAAAPGEHKSLFLQGWLTALSRRPAVEWIEPLLANAGKDFPLDSEVFRAIPADERVKALEIILARTESNSVELHRAMEAWRPFDEVVSWMLLDRFDVPTILSYDAPFYLHPGTLAALEARLVKEAEKHEHRRPVEQAILTVTLRQNLHKEFAR
jgi:hypothetical protein